MALMSRMSGPSSPPPTTADAPEQQVMITDREMIAFVVERAAMRLRFVLPPSESTMYVIDPFRCTSYKCADPNVALLPFRELSRLYPAAFADVKYAMARTAGLVNLDPVNHSAPRRLSNGEGTISIGIDPTSAVHPAMRCSMTTGPALSSGFSVVYHRTCRDGVVEFHDLPEDATLLMGSARVYRQFLDQSKEHGTGQGCSIGGSCAVCDKKEGVMVCCGCKYARYCGPECQAVDWGSHKRRCTRTLLRRGNFEPTTFRVVQLPNSFCMDLRLPSTLPDQTANEFWLSNGERFTQCRQTSLTIASLENMMAGITTYPTLLPIADVDATIVTSLPTADVDATIVTGMPADALETPEQAET